VQFHHVKKFGCQNNTLEPSKQIAHTKLGDVQLIMTCFIIIDLHFTAINNKPNVTLFAEH